MHIYGSNFQYITQNFTSKKILNYYNSQFVILQWQTLLIIPEFTILTMTNNNFYIWNSKWILYVTWQKFRQFWTLYNENGYFSYILWHFAPSFAVFNCNWPLFHTNWTIQVKLCSLIATYFAINLRRNLCVWRRAIHKNKTLNQQSVPRESTYTVFHVKHGNTEYSIGSTESEMPRRNANTKRLKEASPYN